jgi:integrase
MPLTDLALRKLKPKQKPYREFDGGGLYAQVMPTGTIIWRWKYRLGTKEQTYTIGKYPTVSLAEARQKRDDARKLVEIGQNPTRVKKNAKLRHIVESENTFEKVCRRWLEQKSKGMNKKYAEASLSRMERLVFPMIGDLPITEITIPDIVRVLEKVADQGIIDTAKRIKQIMSQTFRYAAQRGLCTHNPASDMRDILPTPEEKHHACIPVAEFPELLQKMAAYKGERVTYIAMHLLALTALRTGELIGASWKEIDLDREEWNIPKERMKMKKNHTIPLSRQAIALLQELHAITGHREQVFFSAASKSKHISNGAIFMALRRMGYQGKMSGHAYRALFSSIMYERDYKPQAIEAQLAHQDQNEVRSAYNYQAQYMLERKKIMQDYADILQEMGAPTREKVISIQRRISQ